jgi:hypothetical protein
MDEPILTADHAGDGYPHPNDIAVAGQRGQKWVGQVTEPCDDLRRGMLTNRVGHRDLVEDVPPETHSGDGQGVHFEFDC